MTDGMDIVVDIIKDAERIEREKSGQALLPDEVRTVKAAAFLLKIAPYAVGENDETPI